jgi:hypothetical protein
VSTPITKGVDGGSLSPSDEVAAPTTSANSAASDHTRQPGRGDGALTAGSGTAADATGAATASSGCTAATNR